MKYFFYILLLFFGLSTSNAQVEGVLNEGHETQQKKLPIDTAKFKIHNSPLRLKIERNFDDSILIETAQRIDMEKILIVSPFKFENREDRRDYLILRRKTMKVWPYAVMASDRLTELRDRLESIESRSAKRKYTKIVQRYLENQFKERLKNLTKTEGQILVKLMYRQTGETTYQIVKDLRSGTRAFFYNVTAGLFTISLKEKLEPLENKDDYYIEHILRMGFQRNLIKYQKPAIDIDYQKITEKWDHH